MTPLELRQRRANLITQAGEILTTAQTEQRDLTAEEQTRFDALHAEADQLKGQIDRLERQAALDAEMRESTGTVAANRQVSNEEVDAERRAADLREAFGMWLRHGIGGLNPEQRTLMEGRFQTVENRAMAAGVDTAGGYTVGAELQKTIETAMAAYSGVRSTRATIIRSPRGNDLPMPTSDDTSNSGELLGENKEAGEQDITVGAKVLRAYMFSSKMLKVSLQFLQDTDIPGIEGWIGERLGERIGRALGAYLIDGTGNNQPEGLAASTTLGRTAAAAAAISYVDLTELEHSVDSVYRRQAEFLLSDGALKVIKQLVDGEGRPLWVPGIATREPDSILGYRYAVDANMPTPASGAITAYFGDFSKFLIRDVTGVQLLRLSERYAEYLQVAFLGFSRHDSCLIDAGTHPIKHLVHP